MNQKDRYYLGKPKPQMQDSHSSLQDTISFHNMSVEDSYVDSLDPEKLMQCPYDKNHQIRACRFPYHLVKCRKNHPDMVQKLVACPFNARHQVPRTEISQHISSCDDKRCIEQDIASQLGSPRREIKVVNTWQSPPCEEDWDKDLSNQSSSVFIWGQSHTELNSSKSNTTAGLTNHLGSDLRTPRSLPHTLPWKNYAGN